MRIDTCPLQGTRKCGVKSFDLERERGKNDNKQ